MLVTRQNTFAAYVKPTSATIRAMKSDAVPDIVGVAAVALASGAVVAALHRMRAVSQPWAFWLVALPLLVGASVWAWYGSDRTSSWDRRKWGYAAIGSLLCGTVFFAIDVLVGSLDGHHKTFLEAASHSGMLGLPLTILVCPVGTVIAFGGWLRSLVEQTSHAAPPHS
ncbi:MAG TPA: hypothetical protein VKT75_11865 [Acidobacteriaceae bacterium]|nr:hypothetical protein [Acidobacteriaceae bacterium]